MKRIKLIYGILEPGSVLKPGTLPRTRGNISRHTIRSTSRNIELNTIKLSRTNIVNCDKLLLRYIRRHNDIGQEHKIVSDKRGRYFKASPLTQNHVKQN